jgi:hypothetical protein
LFMFSPTAQWPSDQVPAIGHPPRDRVAVDVI